MTIPRGPRCMLSAAFFLVSMVFAVSSPRAASPVPGVLQPFVDRNELAGAVTLVAGAEGVVDVAAVGWADIAARRPMKTNDVFWIASMTKAMTAAAVMMLVDEGRVALDDPVEKYLPEMKTLKVAGVSNSPPHAPRRAVTVRDVLSHMSGMSFKAQEEAPTLDRMPLDRAIAVYATTPLLHEPGAKYQYSNMGINTAGRIVEVVSGMPYASFMQKRLFDPLGMRDATFWPSDEQAARLAKSYKPDAAKTNLVEFQIAQLHHPLGDRSARFAMPAGGLFATADDVGRFCRMILRRGELDGVRVLSEASVREMVRRQTPEGETESGGLGLKCGPDYAGHGGAQATHMYVDWKRGLVTVYMVQHAGFPGQGKQGLDAFRTAAGAAFGK